jgi:hypothetical protein
MSSMESSLYWILLFYPTMLDLMSLSESKLLEINTEIKVKDTVWDSED